VNSIKHRCKLGRGVKFKNFGHKNAIKHEKGDPLKSSDYTKYLSQKNLAKPLRTPPLISNYCAKVL
jgi:hypothetical protein